MSAAARSYDILNTNAPTVETLTGTPTRAALARAATGIFSQAPNDVAGIIQQWGIYGREGYNLLGNDPRETGEEIRGPQDPQGRAGGRVVRRLCLPSGRSTRISMRSTTPLA